MRNVILLLSLLFCVNIHAQTSYSCTYRQICTLDDPQSSQSTQSNQNAQSKGSTNCNGYEDNSLFVVNKSETMFTHTTESMKSSYYVESKDYDTKNDLYTYHVVSDVGNRYDYIFDAKNKEVRALANKDGQMRLITFTVKAVF